MKYDLYKHPLPVETLGIVQYLSSVGVDARPTTTVERNHAPEATTLPTIRDRTDGTWYVGLAECVRFYELRSGIVDVVARAKAFKIRSPSFRISDAHPRNVAQAV